MGYEGTQFVVYQPIIVFGDGANFYLITEEKDEGGGGEPWKELGRARGARITRLREGGTEGGEGRCV